MRRKDDIRDLLVNYKSGSDILPRKLVCHGTFFNPKKDLCKVNIRSNVTVRWQPPIVIGFPLCFNLRLQCLF
eukprot:10313777-Karenia_brevis.AAC.1